MPRRPSAELRTEWKISLPAPLAAQVEYLLLDARSMKSKYGSRAALIAQLLSNWVTEQGLDPHARATDNH